MHKKQALIAALGVVFNAIAEPGASGSNTKKQPRTRKPIDTTGYTKLSGTAPDGTEVHSWNGKLLPATGKKSAKVKLVDGNGHFRGIVTLQDAREGAVAMAHAITMLSTDSASSATQQ